MKRTLTIFACLSISLLAAGAAPAQDAIGIVEPQECVNPTKSTTVNVGDTVCVRDPGHAGPFLVPPVLGGGCPANYTAFVITTVDLACTAAHILTPDPAGCTPECCKSITIVNHEDRTLTSCKRTKERDCQKEASDAAPGDK